MTTAAGDAIEARIDLVDGAFWGRDPHEELSWLREHAPVWRDPRTGVWGVATYELVKYVSSQPQLFSSAGGIRPDYDPAPHMIDMDDPAHAMRRKLVNRGFTPRRVREQEPAIRATVAALIDAAVDASGADGDGSDGDGDLVADFAAWLPLIVIGDAIGFDPDERQQLLEWSDDLMRMLGTADDATRERGLAAAGEYIAHVGSLIEQRRTEPGDDLLSTLVHAEVDGDRLDDFELVIESLLLLIGGDETTRHVISGGVYQLLSRPNAWRDLIHDRSLVPSAVEEMLRWVSPVKNMARTTTADAELGDFVIPAGDKVLLLYPSANRDDAVFDDPFTFDIRRSPNEHVAFGFGPHFCLGASLARLELRLALEELLDRVPNLELVGNAEPAHRPANFVSGYEHLPVRWRR